MGWGWGRMAPLKSIYRVGAGVGDPPHTPQPSPHRSTNSTVRRVATDVGRTAAKRLRIARAGIAGCGGRHAVGQAKFPKHGLLL
jgi:hypothetical protein